MTDGQAVPPPADFDAWLDGSDHNAYEMARAAYDAGHAIAARAAAAEREACAQLAAECGARYGAQWLADVIRARTTP